MALLTLRFEIQGTPGNTIDGEWSHTGVVGSGDLEILMEKKEQGGMTDIQVVTPVKGFDYVWEAVMRDFVESTGIGDVHIEINDNNATPFIVALRMKQAWREAKGGKE